MIFCDYTFGSVYAGVGGGGVICFLTPPNISLAFGGMVKNSTEKC